MATFKTRKSKAQAESPEATEVLTLIYQVSRLVKDKEKGDQLLLREYYNGGVKALARVYFGWEVTSLSGLAIAMEYGGETTHTVEIDSDYYMKMVVPLAKWESQLRKGLKPYNGRLANPKTNREGVSMIYNIQLRVTLEGDPRLHVTRNKTAEGREYNWEVYQFEPQHVVNVEVVNAADDKFILPVMKGQEVDFALAMETKKKTRRRRGKQSKDHRLRGKRQELQEVLRLKQEVTQASTVDLERDRKLKEIEDIEAEIQLHIEEIEAMI